MPNHVTNYVNASKEVIDAMIRTVSAAEQEADYKADVAAGNFVMRKSTFEDVEILDFGLVIPMPERIFTGGCNGQHPHPHPDGGVYDHCWWDWNRANWGTKWNAYDMERINDEEVRFDTAWNHPLKVIEALAQKFPTEAISVRFADEDLGSNCGSYTIVKDQLLAVRSWDKPCDESRDFAAQLKYGRSYAEMRKEWGEEDEDDE